MEVLASLLTEQDQQWGGNLKEENMKMRMWEGKRQDKRDQRKENRERRERDEITNMYIYIERTHYDRHMHKENNMKEAQGQSKHTIKKWDK